MDGDANLNMDLHELFTCTKDIADTFLKVTTPGIFIQIKMRCVEKCNVEEQIKCRIHIWEKTFTGNKLIRKVAYTIKKENHLQKYSHFLDGLKTTYGKGSAELSDSE